MKYITLDDTEIDLSLIGVDLAAQMTQIGFAKSKSEARRLIEGGAIRLNDVLVTDKFARLTFHEGNFVLVQRKKLEKK